MEKTGTRSWLSVSLYILLLLVTATTRDFGVSPLVARSLGSLAVAFVEPLWKLLFWIIPMLLLLRYSNAHQSILSYLKLNRHVIRGVAWGIIASSLFLFQGIGLLVRGEHLLLTHTPDVWINDVLLVGLIEESIFRGFLYQWLQKALASKTDIPRVITPVEDPGAFQEEDNLLLYIRKRLPLRSEVWAALLSTLVFAAVHFPVWIMVLHMPLWLMVSSTIFNLLFGLGQCALLKYSGSLWSCIIVHMINNLVLLLF